jgi:hypothetical protein
VNLTLASCIKPDGFSPVSGLFASPPSAEDLSGSANSICSIKITLYHSGDNITAGMHEAVDPFGTEVRIVFGTSTTIPARAPLSVGAIVGIAVGCAFVVFIFAFIVSTVLCNGDKGNYDAAAAVAAKAAARQAAYVPPVRNTHIPPVVQQQNRHDADLMPDLAVALADGNNRSPVKPPLKSSVKLRKSAQSADTSPKVLRDSQIAAMSEDELLRLAMEESMKTASKSEIKQSKRAPPPKRADVDDLELAIQMSLAADSPQTAEKNKGRDSISSSTSKSSESYSDSEKEDTPAKSPTIAATVSSTSSRRVRPGDTEEAPTQPLKKSRKREEQEQANIQAEPEPSLRKSKKAVDDGTTEPSLKKSRKDDVEKVEMAPEPSIKKSRKGDTAVEAPEAPLKKSRKTDQAVEASIEEAALKKSRKSESTAATEPELKKSRKADKEQDAAIDIPASEPEPSLKKSKKAQKSDEAVEPESTLKKSRKTAEETPEPTLKKSRKADAQEANDAAPLKKSRRERKDADTEVNIDN